MTRSPAPHFSTKQRILDVAEALFAEHGFAGTSLRQVTSRADVNIAAVNYHFGSKENLVYGCSFHFTHWFNVVYIVGAGYLWFQVADVYIHGA